MAVPEVSQVDPTTPFSAKTLAAFAENVKARSSKRDGDILSESQEQDMNIREGSILTSGEFLRFIPENEAAQLAFHELACKKQSGDLNLNHAQFITIKGKGRLADEAGYDHGLSGDGTSAESFEEQGVDEDIYKGYFAVDFSYSTVTEGTKWVLGKGTKKSGPDLNVDILLAMPGSRHRRHLAPAHAFLRMNLQSGAWMLMAGHECSHTVGKGYPPESIDHTELSGLCSHAPVWIDGRAKKHFQSESLNRPRTSFVIGGLRYVAEFTIGDLTSEESYLQKRNVWLYRRDIPIPATGMSSIPFESDIHTTFAVFRQGVGSGTFGTVYEGFEPQNGDLRAIKKIVLKSAADKPEVESEVAAHEEFKETTGIVRFYGCRNSLGGINTTTKTEPSWPFEVYIIMERGKSFLECFREKPITIDGACRRMLCKQLLTGLVAIHGNGWMHRDITPMNVLYFGQEPTHASLCDFGKLCRSATSNITTLAAWRWLPPEIRENERRTYDLKVDIWMLGYTLVYCWYYDCQQGMVMRNGRDHATVLQRLGNDSDRHLSHLIIKMLAWEPKDRPSANEALADPCLRDLELDDEPVAQRVPKKRSAERGLCDK